MNFLFLIFYPSKSHILSGFVKPKRKFPRQCVMMATWSLPFIARLVGLHCCQGKSTNQHLPTVFTEGCSEKKDVCPDRIDP